MTSSTSGNGPSASTAGPRTGNGEGEDAALSDAELGDKDDGGLKGQGGMRDPEKTSEGEDGKFRPS